MQSEKLQDKNSNTIDLIISQLNSMPKYAQCEVLDFVNFLKTRQMQPEIKPTEDEFWSDFSLSSAMRGMDGEESIYTSADIREPCE